MMLIIKRELERAGDPVKAEHHYGFFKAGPGGYGEGDRFFGVTVPRQRTIARQYYRDISLVEVEKLLQDPYHECRLTALFILRLRFEKASREAGKNSSLKKLDKVSCERLEQEKIVELYLRNIAFVNNWDLVDSSAPYLLGPYLATRDTTLLDELAVSGELWKQRVAVLTTFYFIRQDRFDETLRLAKQFLNHPHDLMHKAVGWMLREIGKRDINVEYAFLKEHYSIMPRTMLRYAIERFDPALRQKFLQGTVENDVYIS